MEYLEVDKFRKMSHEPLELGKKDLEVVKNLL
jgi:hypothetical protein